MNAVSATWSGSLIWRNVPNPQAAPSQPRPSGVRLIARWRIWRRPSGASSADVSTRYIDRGFGLLGGEVAFIAAMLTAVDNAVSGPYTVAYLYWEVLAYVAPLRSVSDLRCSLCG